MQARRHLVDLKALILRLSIFNLTPFANSLVNGQLLGREFHGFKGDDGGGGLDAVGGQLKKMKTTQNAFTYLNPSVLAKSFHCIV